MKVLFIARRFPPSIGGMQQFAYDLSEALPGQDIQLIKVTWGGSSRLTLPFVLPWLFFRGLWILITDRSIDVIHMQDAVLSPLGWLLSKLSRKPWVVVAHGLDLTFKLKFYQKVNLFFARRCDAIVAISEATADEARKREISNDKITVIPLGVDDTKSPRVSRDKILEDAGLPKDAKILITVGRLARRKGVAWFINSVMPELDKDVHYIVIGDGQERSNIEQVIHKQDLSDRVNLLGAVDEATKKKWLSVADVFVMPNIKVPGDMEGFGIVAHEAALAELPVVASNLEGIAQALQDNKNGILLPSQDTVAYHKAIKRLLGNAKLNQEFGKQARKYTLDNFGWPVIAKQYRQIYEELFRQQ